jgi:hypothetical protein
MLPQGENMEATPNDWKAGDRVRVFAPMTPWNGHKATVIEVTTRKVGGIRYTVRTDLGGELFLSVGSLRRESEP